MFYWLLLGLLLGILCTTIVVQIFAAGTLKVFIPDDVSEPPCLGLKLDKPLQNICKKSVVVFRVDIRNINSQD